MRWRSPSGRRGKAMGVRHVGVVTGTGGSRCGGPPRPHPIHLGRAAAFPIWLGGPIGGIVGVRVMRMIWRRNLRNLKALVEG